MLNDYIWMQMETWEIEFYYKLKNDFGRPSLWIDMFCLSLYFIGVVKL